MRNKNNIDKLIIKLFKHRVDVLTICDILNVDVYHVLNKIKEFMDMNAPKPTYITLEDFKDLSRNCYAYLNKVR